MNFRVWCQGPTIRASFDLDFTGLDRRISVTIPVDLGLWNDVNPEDNEVTQNGVDIEVGPIGASISQSNSNGIYTTDETMTLVARTRHGRWPPQLHVED